MVGNRLITQRSDEHVDLDREIFSRIKADFPDANPEGYFSEWTGIKYCPMCGRRLSPRFLFNNFRFDIVSMCIYALFWLALSLGEFLIDNSGLIMAILGGVGFAAAMVVDEYNCRMEIKMRQ